MLKAWNPAPWGSRSPRSSESLNPQIPRSWNPRIRESWNPIILKSWNNLGILESQNLNNPGILIQQIPYSYILMYLIRMILESMKPGPDFKTRTGIFLQPGPEYPDRKKLRTGPYSITRTGIETRTGMDRTGKNWNPDRKQLPGPGFFWNPDRTGPEICKSTPGPATRTGRIKTRNRTGPDRNIPVIVARRSHSELFPVSKTPSNCSNAWS